MIRRGDSVVVAVVDKGHRRPRAWRHPDVLDAPDEPNAARNGRVVKDIAHQRMTDAQRSWGFRMHHGQIHRMLLGGIRRPDFIVQNVAQDGEAAVPVQQIEQIEPLRFRDAPGSDPFSANPIGKDGLAFEHDDLYTLAGEHGRQRTAANASAHNYNIWRCTGHHSHLRSAIDCAKRDYGATFNDWR